MTQSKITLPIAKKDGDKIKVIFSYNPILLEVVKNTSQRKWNPEEKSWTCSISIDNLKILNKGGFKISQELIEWYKENKPKPPVPLELDEDPNAPYKLRPYQKQAIASGLLFIRDVKQKRPGVIVLPTGAGKSLVIAEITRRTRSKTIVLQPSKELLEQNYTKYLSYGERAEIYSASFNRKKVGDVTFATIGSIVNKPELFADFDLCIIDECHLVSPEPGTMYEKFLNELKIKTLGLTATPIRMKAYSFPHRHTKLCMLDRMKPRYFSQYIHITQIKEMVDGGWWSRLVYKEGNFNGDMLKLNSTGRDFTDESIQEAYNLNNIKDYILKITQSTRTNHCLVFVPSVDDAYELQQEIPQSAVLESSMDRDLRIQYLEAFKVGRIKTIINVNILGIGFDFPELDCIITARPTRSLSVYYQQIGRGVRTSPNKELCYVFDLAGNMERFGKVEDLEIKRVDGLMCIESNGKQLTNVDLTKEEDRVPIIPFGKYRGQRADRMPFKEVEKFLKDKPKNIKYNALFDWYDAQMKNRNQV